jgi:hypothetical protein
VPIHGPDAYNLLKLATEAFLFFECGVKVEPPRDPRTGCPPADGNRPITGEEGRIGAPITIEQAQTLLQQYLVGPDHRVLPYLDRVSTALVGLDEARRQGDLQHLYCDDILTNRLTCPSLLE